MQIRKVLHFQKVKDVYLQDFFLNNIYGSLESILGTYIVVIMFDLFWLGAYVIERKLNFILRTTEDHWEFWSKGIYIGDS